jgi:ribosomal protein S18 acetylase RimI-like enzyme
MFSISIFKHLVLVIAFPITLMGAETVPNYGAWPDTDKNNNKVILEWNKITDYQTLLETERTLIPVLAAAFAHEISEAKSFNKKVSRTTVLLEKRNEALMNEYFQSKQVKKCTCFVVTMKDKGTFKILGYAIFHVKPEFGKGFMWLEPLAVIPQAQRRGLGTLLVFSILKIAAKINQEVNQIVLGVRYENTDAQAFYEKLKFSVIQEHEEGKVLSYVING